MVTLKVQWMAHSNLIRVSLLLHVDVFRKGIKVIIVIVIVELKLPAPQLINSCIRFTDKQALRTWFPGTLYSQPNNNPRPELKFLLSHYVAPHSSLSINHRLDQFVSHKFNLSQQIRMRESWTRIQECQESKLNMERRLIVRWHAPLSNSLVLSVQSCVYTL